MGDLSCIMPVVHPYCAGYVGTGHGSDFYITDPMAACVDSARWQLCMLKLLLQNGAERANNIIKEFKPLFATKEDYLAYIEDIRICGDRIIYTDEGASVKL
jgi:hypothetical protein